MKRIYGMLCAVLLSATMLTSCLGDNDETTTAYSDVAITQLTLGTLNRYTNSISSKTGNDTVLKTTVTGSAYSMTIDQLQHRIYNQRELPIGTDVAHVVLSTVSTRSGGIVALQSMTSDSLQWLSTSDSIDFSVPRVLRVYASDGSAHRDYTVTLNVSQTTGITFAWSRERTGIEAGLDSHRLVAWADSVVAVPHGIIVRGDVAFRLDSDGYVETSADMAQWTRVSTVSPGLRCLIGAGTAELFALGTDGRLKHCYDSDLDNWADEQLDDADQLLPDDQLAMVSWRYAPVDEADYVLLVGSNSRQADAAYASVWRKISQYGASERSGQWVFMPADDANPYRLPSPVRPSLACYDGVVLAVAADMVVRQSSDQGISWQTSADYALPSTLSATAVSMAADRQGRLWLLTDQGELWLGSKR